MSPEQVTRPLVRWHGGKFRLAPWILSFLPTHRTYVEPFGGGGSVLLRKERSYAEVYNDLDGEIVNLFRVARDHGEELCRLVELTPFARGEFAVAWQTSEDPMERAMRLLIRAWFGMGTSAATRDSGTGRPNTGFRSATKIRGNQPALDWARFPRPLAAIVDRLRGVVIEQKDAFTLIAKMDGPDALLYVDPPYLPETRDDARPDYRHELTREDHGRLAEVLKAAQGKVVLSGYDSSFYEDLYQGWHRVERAALADGARPRTEVLWMNFTPGTGPMQLTGAARPIQEGNP